jgi:hypothetical protein
MRIEFTEQFLGLHPEKGLRAAVGLCYRARVSTRAMLRRNNPICAVDKPQNALGVECVTGA